MDGGSIPPSSTGGRGRARHGRGHPRTAAPGKRSRPTSRVTATARWSCCASMPTTSRSSTATSRPSGDEIARAIVASGSGMPILMLTAADRLDDKASRVRCGTDDSSPSRSSCRSWCCSSRALDRRRARNRPPVRRSRSAPGSLPPLRSTGTAGTSRDQEAVRRARGPRSWRRRCHQRGGALGAGVGRERRPVHQRRAHHGLGAAQTARRTLARSPRCPGSATAWTDSPETDERHNTETEIDTGSEEGDRG